MKRYLMIFLIVFSISTSWSFSTDYAHETKHYQPAPHHQHSLVAILNLLEQKHYQPRVLDDSLSSKIFDNYFEILDRRMLYLTQTHIKTFEGYRFQLDNVLRSGDLQVVFDIYNLFHLQFISRHQKIDQLLSEIVLDQENPDDIRPNNAKEQDRRWYAVLSQEIQKEIQAGKTMQAAREAVKSKYVNAYKKHMDYTNDEVFQWFMYAFTKTYDPHTWYSSPALKKQEKIQMSLTFGGIGVTIDEQDNYPYITHVSTNGPAHKSGHIRRGDRILAFAEAKDPDFQSLEGWIIDKVIRNVRGEIGSKLILVISRDPDPIKRDTVELIREEIQLEQKAARGEIVSLDHGSQSEQYGVITIPSFYRDFDAYNKKKEDYKSLTRDVRNILDSLTRQPIGGLLLDLRGNGGGYLAEAIELTDLFISNGTIVQVKNADGSIKTYDSPDKGKVYYDGMLAVLIDRNSASASEIFAGAIQDHGRGIILGERSFGKGTVQFNYDLENIVRQQLNRQILLKKSMGLAAAQLECFRDSLQAQRTLLGKIKITGQMFYLPGGKSTQLHGVQPDISFPSSDDLKTYGERSKCNALDSDQIIPGIIEQRKRIDSVSLMKLKKQHLHQQSSNPAWKNYQDHPEENKNIYIMESLRLLSKACDLVVR